MRYPSVEPPAVTHVAQLSAPTSTTIIDGLGGVGGSETPAGVISISTISPTAPGATPTAHATAEGTHKSNTSSSSGYHVFATTDTVTYIHSDHLGSVSTVTNQSGGVVATQQYDPWGKVRSGGISVVDLNYTGQRKDDTGLLYYHARYYDPSLARFVSPDSIVPGAASGVGGAGGSVGAWQNSSLTVDFHESGFIKSGNSETALLLDKGFWSDSRDANGPKNPQALSRYSYVLNNPLRYIDPTGHDADRPCMGCYRGPGPTSKPTPSRGPVPTNAQQAAEDRAIQRLLEEGLKALLSMPIGARPIMRYGDARLFTAGKNHAVEAHHILEQRFLKQWGHNLEDAPAVVLTKAEHDFFTRQLQAELKTGVEWTKEQVWSAYQKVYRDFPQWLQAIKHYFK